MVSRIDLGPDGGPYVEIDEDAGGLVIRVPNDTVDFDSNDLLNAVLQNATMDGGSLDGVSLSSALDANNQDLNSVGTASVTALEAESVSTEQADITDQESLYAYLSTDQSIGAGNLEQIEFDATRFDNKDEWNTTDNEFTANRAGTFLVSLNVRFLGPSSGDALEIRALLNGSASSGLRHDKTAATGDSQTLNWTTLLRLSAGDILTFEARNEDSDDTLEGRPERTSVSIHKVA